MRPHRKRQPLAHQLPTATPPQLDHETATWLAESANFRTDPSTVDYSTCQGCGHPIAFGETVGIPTPPHPRIQRICWNCLISILLYRAILLPADADWPAQHGTGTWTPRFDVLEVALEGDRRPYGPSEAQKKRGH